MLSGLYLPTSDIDLVVMDSKCGDVPIALKALASSLLRRSMAKGIQVGSCFLTYTSYIPLSPASLLRTPFLPPDFFSPPCTSLMFPHYQSGVLQQKTVLLQVHGSMFFRTCSPHMQCLRFWEHL